MPDRVARAAKHQRARRLVEAQHVDDGVLDVGRRDADRAIFDIGVTALVAGDLDPEGVALILPRQRDDAAWKRRREQQGAARLRRGLENEFHVLAKAEIEHLVGLVEHDRGELGDVETAAPQMIAEPPGRADHDVRACRELALLAPRIHAADTGDDSPAGMPVEPGQLALDLKCELAGRRHDQGKRGCRGSELLGILKKIFRDGQSVGDSLA